MKARIPADVEMPDRVLAGLTLRQLLILAGAGLVVWALYMIIGRWLPAGFFAAITAPVVAAGLLAATVKPAGLNLERLAYLAAHHLLLPGPRVPAPEGTPQRAKLRAQAVGALQFPVEDITPEGLIDLGAGGAGVICSASSLSFVLRSEAEQRALLEGFGGFLNALEGPTQFVVRSERAQVRSLIAQLEEGAAFLPHAGLTGAAREHAAFLRSLAARRGVLNRRVYLCFRQPGAFAEASAKAERRVDEAELTGKARQAHPDLPQEAARPTGSCGQPPAPRPLTRRGWPCPPRSSGGRREFGHRAAELSGPCRRPASGAGRLDRGAAGALGDDGEGGEV